MSNLFAKFILALTIVIAINLPCAFGQQVDKIPYTLFDDFETGELFGWETYPYAQDIAFDALYSTRNNPTYKGSRYALARPLKANDTNELEQGFTKQLNFWTTDKTVVKCAIYFQSDRNPQTLEISVGTFDGRRFFHNISNPKANEWLELNIPTKEFHENGKPLGSGEHIQVVTVKGSYSIVSYLYTYTILMDDFEINGERQRRFIATSPSATNLDMFGISILNKHFFAGDKISLNVVTEGDIPMREVRGKLLDGKGEVLKNNLKFILTNGKWVNEFIHQVNAKDNRGQWKVELSGISNEGKIVEWEFRFLVPIKKINGHPRLFFSADELHNRIKNEKSPVAKKILDKALEKTAFMKVDIDAIEENVDRTAENLVGPPYGKNSSGYNAFQQWRNPMNKLGDVIREGSFRYAFTGDVTAAEQAKKALLKLCSFSKWNNNWMLERKFHSYYPVGYIMKPIAYGYDMLYDILTDSERKFVRNAIMEKGLKLFYRDMVEMNRKPSQQTNHIAVSAVGNGLAAIAIYGDDPENPSLEPYISGVMTKAKAFLDHTYYEDGSYAEPVGYMDMASKPLVELIATIERNFGIDYTTTTNISSFYKYPLYATFDNGLYQIYGDDGNRTYSGFTQVHSNWMVYRTGNPYLYQYLKPLLENGGGGYMGYLWYRDDITPISRNTLPTMSQTFKEKGMVMRSGWNDRSTVITTRVGPNSNHYHYDQGSFQIMTNGEELLSDPGIGAAGYYANYEFLSYDVRAIAHNVMLVDHDPESQNPAHYDNGIASLREWPRMTLAFNSKVVDVVRSDLTSVYKKKLKVYNRTLLYNRGGALFLFDEVKSNSPKGEVYDWLFHAPKNKEGQLSINISGNRLTINRTNARLTMDVISPEVIKKEPKDVSIPVICKTKITDRYDLKAPESFATFSSNEGQRSVNFFAAIVPEAKPENGEFAKQPHTEKFESDRWIGAKVKHAGGVDYGFFKKNEIYTGVSSLSKFTADARYFSTSYDNKEQLVSVYLEGTLLNVDGFSLSTKLPLSCAVTFSSNNTEIETDSNNHNELTISFQKKPAKIILNGITTKEWKYNKDKQELIIKLPKGKKNILIQ